MNIPYDKLLIPSSITLISIIIFLIVRAIGLKVIHSCVNFSLANVPDLADEEKTASTPSLFELGPLRVKQSIFEKLSRTFLMVYVQEYYRLDVLCWNRQLMRLVIHGELNYRVDKQTR